MIVIRCSAPHLNEIATRDEQAARAIKMMDLAAMAAAEGHYRLARITERTAIRLARSFGREDFQAATAQSGIPVLVFAVRNRWQLFWMRLYEDAMRRELARVYGGEW